MPALAPVYIEGCMSREPSDTAIEGSSSIV
jgi:hypothetical protein